MKRVAVLVCLSFLPVAAEAHDDQLFLFTQADRLEYQAHDHKRLWDLQGWYGSDYHKLWWKTEGKRKSDGNDKTEVQLLYSRATGAYFDLQLGLRFSDIEDQYQTSVAFGVQGDAPYRIEYDIVSFLSDEGKLSVRGEFERDFLLTQKLIIQPRMEATVEFSDSPAQRIESGLHEIELGLRLRYEFTRKFAPYLGIEWQRNGFTDETTSSAIAGLRFWF